MVGRGQAGERDPGAVIGRDRLRCAPVHRDRVAVGVEARARRARRHRQVARRRGCRGAGHRKRRGHCLSGGHGLRLRGAPAHRAIGRDVAERDGVSPGGEGVRRGVVVRERLALATIDRDGVAVGVRRRTGGAGDDPQVTCRRGRRRTGHRERHRRGLPGRDRHRAGGAGRHRAIRCEAPELDGVAPGGEPGVRRRIVDRDRAGLAAVNRHGIAVGVRRAA